MGTIITILVIAVIIAIASSSNGNKNHVNCDGSTYININDVKMDNPKAQQVFDYYKSMIIGKKINFDEVLHDVNLRREYHKIKQIQNTLQDDDDLTYIEALENEFTNLTSSITPNGIILNPQEECYFSAQICAVDTIQRVAKNITYSGIKTTNGSIRFGSGTIYSNNVEGLRRFDAGTIIVTNQRIIFKGTKKNKTIAIGSIISIDNFDDNGVIISMSNRENPIVIRFAADKCFYYNKTNDIRFFYNDLNWFYKALEKSFYKRFIPKDVQDIRKEVDKLNFDIARKTMIKEGFEKENK